MIIYGRLLFRIIRGIRRGFSGMVFLAAGGGRQEAAAGGGCKKNPGAFTAGLFPVSLKHDC